MFAAKVRLFPQMAKKTVLKKCLKYAPLKSDFARGITADETIKTEISDDMYAIPAQEYYEAEAVDVNPDTGEVIPDN